jgi:hypothetical protein
MAVLWIPFGRSLARAAEPDGLADIYSRLDARVGLRVARLGKAYLRRHPAEASRSRLAELIEAADGGSLHSALTQGELAMQTALGEVYKRDFEAERVVRVEGWVLSLTEARLHAWRHLIAA